MDNPKVAVRKTRKFGRGVYALKNIRRGELIAVFDGRRYDLKYKYWTDDISNHAIQYGRGQWRDSKGLARFINHSCAPNCGIKGLFRVVAMRDIKRGEPITWDYEMTEKSSWWRMRCHCGTPDCRRRIGSYVNLPKAKRLEYRGFISRWLTATDSAVKLTGRGRRGRRKGRITRG